MILFNHESPRRGENSLQKITQAAARIFKGEQDVVQLGISMLKRLGVCQRLC